MVVEVGTDVLAGVGEDIMKVSPLLACPQPPLFQACIHQVYIPSPRVSAGAIEHMVPLQFASLVLYIPWNTVPDGPFTCSR